MSTGKRGKVTCPSCGERFREKAPRCPSCGTANPLQERPSLDERIGTGGALALLVAAGAVLLLLVAWLAYELLALGRLNPYLVAAAGLLALVGIGGAVARRWRR